MISCILLGGLGNQLFIIFTTIDDNNSDNNPFNNNKIITLDFIENGKKVKKKATINYTFNNINNALKYLISKIQK